MTNDHSKTEPAELAIGPLDDDDVDLLLEAFAGVPDEEYRVVTEEPEGRRVGDPGTLVAVIVLSQAAISGITAFLMKRRQRSSIEYRTSTTYADGTQVHAELTVKASDSEAPSPELVAQIESLTRQQVPRMTEGEEP